MPSFVVAIDGPAASGKGTLAKTLAKHFSFDALDTGLIYRAVARGLLDAGIDPSDPALATAAAQNLSLDQLKRPDLRGETVGQAASICSSVPGVRAALLDFQVRFASKDRPNSGAILDGRDIGTAVCPNAQVKLWITASPEVRASRRFAEASAAGDFSQTVENIAASIAERDHRERTRPVSPLIPAQDALIIDTTHLSVGEVFEQAKAQIEMALLSHRSSLSARPAASTDGNLPLAGRVFTFRPR